MLLLPAFLALAGLASARIATSDVVPCWYGTDETFYKCWRIDQCPRHCIPGNMRRCRQIDIYEYFALLGPMYGQPVGFGPRRPVLPFPDSWY